MLSYAQNDELLTLNPEQNLHESPSRILKRPQKIGKIVSKISELNIHQSHQSANFNGVQSPQQPLKEGYELGRRQPLLSNKSLYLQQLNQQQIDRNYSSVLQMVPLTNKSYRINKVHSSSSHTKEIKKRKTPQIIGKLSTSKIKLQLITEPSKLQQSNLKLSSSLRNKSPGYLTSRQTFYNKRNRSPLFIVQPSVLNEQTEQVQPSSGKSNILPQITSENQALLSQVKQKEKYLKNLIQKHRQQVTINSSNRPVPKKNIKQLSYHYPVSNKKNNMALYSKNPYNPYLQKIQQNSKGFKSFLSAPKKLSISRKSSSLKQGNQDIKKVKTRMSRLEDSDEVLQKSRGMQMRISPQINISFTVKSPRVRPQNSFSKNEVHEESLSNRQLQSSLIAFNSDKMKNFNNRKPKFVNMLIDPLPQQYQQDHILQPQTESRQNNMSSIDIAKLSKFFSRPKLSTQYDENFKFDNNTSQLQYSINLHTKISTLKQILIQSTNKLNLNFHFPSTIFNNPNINANAQIQELHWFMEKVYNDLQIRPQIVTIKRYQNAIFTGVLKAQLKNQNLYSAIIYHFNGVVYVGDWKQSKSNSKLNNTIVEGFKDGIGLQINLKDTNVGNKKHGKQTLNSVQTQVYYGQFQNSLRSGYGIKLASRFASGAIEQQILQIGCWKDSQKHGWVKTFLNGNMIESAQYDHSIATKKRSVIAVQTSRF